MKHRIFLYPPPNLLIQPNPSKPLNFENGNLVHKECTWADNYSVQFLQGICQQDSVTIDKLQWLQDFAQDWRQWWCPYPVPI